MKKMTDLNYTVRLMTKMMYLRNPGGGDKQGMQEGTHCLYTWLEVDKGSIQHRGERTG
ncbi:hypothetical protein AVEN_138169-1, partial [Araneus ventricosus]